jgi:UDP-N-acetylmuramate dehydrogenase
VSAPPGALGASVQRRLDVAEKLHASTDIQRRLGIRATRDESLARLTTMRVGGPADLFAEARNAFELRGIVRYALTRDIPLFLIGRGSNIVVSDAGIGGLVVHVRAEGHRSEEDRLVAEAGLPMARAATVTREAGLAGLEFGLAIPGSVGGAVWANAGAHGSDVSSVLREAHVVTADGSEVVQGPADLGLAYRDSRLKHGAPGRPEVVISAVFELEPADPGTISARLDDIRRWRQAHQPVGQKSAGSVFRNPEGDAAGRIIDELGLKGRRVGGAMVSPLHANFIINTDGASATDVRRLAEEVREHVRSERGIELRYEIEFVGDWPPDEEAEADHDDRAEAEHEDEAEAHRATEAEAHRATGADADHDDETEADDEAEAHRATGAEAHRATGADADSAAETDAS